MTDLYNFVTSTYGNFWLWTVLIAFTCYYIGLFHGSWIQHNAYKAIANVKVKEIKNIIDEHEELTK